MNVMLLLAVAAFSGIALAYVLSPLIMPPAFTQEDAPDEARDALLQRRASAYLAIRELEADYQQGKVDDAAYAASRAELEANAIAVLQAIDALTPPVRSPR